MQYYAPVTLRKSIIVPPLTNHPPYQILPHTNSYFHCLYSYPDLLPQGPWGTPGGQSPPGTLGATGEGLDSCEDSESIC